MTMCRIRVAVLALGASLLVGVGLAMPVAAHAASAAYVADEGFPFGGSFEVSEFGIGAGDLLSPLSPPTVPTGGSGSPQAVAVSPDGRSAYVVNLGPLPPPFGNGTGSVSEYDIDPATGALSPKTTSSVPAGGFAEAIAVSPDGRNAYVANGDSTVSQYTIDTGTGALSPMTPATVPDAGFGSSVAVTPDGKSVYVATLAGSVSQYDVDPATGALTAKSPATIDTGGAPRGVAVTPDGKSAYVTDSSGGRVLQYSIDPVTGSLSPKAPLSAAAGSQPYGIAVSPDGRSAYVTNATFDGAPSDTVSQYNVDPVTGLLSPKTPATVPAGTAPVAIALTAEGANAYVADVSDPTSGVSQYSVDPTTGDLSPKTPAIVSAGILPVDVAVSAGPVPTSKEQCMHGGWRNFPQFKNQGQCISFVEHHG